MFQRLLYLLLVILPGVLFSQAVGGAEAPQYRQLDRVVAIVNDDVIVLSELDNRIRAIRSELSRTGTQEPPDHVLRKQVLDRLILDRLQLQVADRSGIRVDDETLNRAVTEMARRNGLGLREFRDILERDGYDFAKFREQIRQEMRISRIQKQQVKDRVNVTAQEVDNLLAMTAKQGSAEDEYRIAHILIAVPEAASSEEIARAGEKTEEVLTKLRSGADFAQTAVAVSDGQQALQGGDLGWRKATQLPTLFAETVPAMRIGDISDAVRSTSGFHIIKLVDKRGEERHVVTQTLTRHILIQTDELTSDVDARSRLEQLRERIENGEDFAELARSHSDDKGSAVDGGELGWVNPGDVVPAFEEVMDSLAPGQMSEPFRTEFGWHMVQVLDRREHDSTKEAQRTKAREQIRQRKTEEELQTWLRQMRDEAYVEYRLEE